MLTRRSLLALLAASSATGCYGRFALTHKLYSWNGTIGGKFLSTVVMWVLMIVPVYELCSFVDLFILNLLEFWTGSNPMAEVQHPDGSATRFARLSKDSVRVTRVLEGREFAFDVVLENGRALMVRGVDGAVLASGEALADGSLALATEGRLRFVSAGDVEAASQARRPSEVVSRVLAGEVLASR